ncbi:hypothetical protein BT63DRAFT_463993 [Microthyrium microscopicum]|uniref:Cyclase n=1 Tax=Microthyrium microscopicum TaxID=703497 RepID=A0A6A6U313_9PEZI|nr:hypothetical protein BT63DRAFT_463993 [Microthyrium microscopicum]
MSDLKLPSWNEIPPVKGQPHGCAWGLFDKDGVRDEVGTLNLLTPSAVIRARQEIQTGKSVCLNWGMEKLHEPGFNRTKLQHKIVDWRKKPGFTFYSYDDEITVNTQAGSQWDGLRHWGHTETGLYYNGIHHDDLIQSTHLGIDHWSKRGGIVGRGVLLDYVAYMAKKGKEFDPMSKHPISLPEIKEMIADQGLELLPGDLLLVRSGWIKWYEENSEERRREKITNGGAWIGVHGNQETLEWLWNNHFCAVASDSIGFEQFPNDPGYSLHNWLLSLWGTPIGEMWDLEALAEECQKHKRWSFFITSTPLLVEGGVASPPNAVAIF